MQQVYLVTVAEAYEHPFNVAITATLETAVYEALTYLSNKQRIRNPDTHADLPLPALHFEDCAYYGRFRQAAKVAIPCAALGEPLTYYVMIERFGVV